jgi:hypothetical protein
MLLDSYIGRAKIEMACENLKNMIGSQLSSAMLDQFEVQPRNKVILDVEKYLVLLLCAICIHKSVLFCKYELDLYLLLFMMNFSYFRIAFGSAHNIEMAYEVDSGQFSFCS